MKSLEQRIEALERSNRRWRYGAVALMLALGFSAAAKSPPSVVDVTRTRTIEIVNQQGIVVAKITATADGVPTAQFFKADGKVAINLGVLGGSGFFTIYGEKDYSGLYGGRLSVHDQTRNTTTNIAGASLTIGNLPKERADPLKFVNSKDPKAYDRYQEAVTKEIEEARRGERIRLGIFEHDGGYVEVLNPHGKIVAEMQSSKVNAGLIVAKDVDGNTKEALSGG